MPAVAALLEDGHAGRVHELTGPRALTFAEVADVISRASGRPVAFRSVTVEEFRTGLTTVGLPADVVDLLTYLTTTVLDGRGPLPTDGVRRALGRERRDLAVWAEESARAGAWAPVPAAG